MRTASIECSRRAPEVVVVAAHGSRQADAARIVQDHVKRLQSQFGLSAVAAFHIGRPGLDEVLDRVRAHRFVVVPFFSSDGYYSRTVLPDALARNRRFGQVHLRRTRAVGTDPTAPDIVHGRVLRLACMLNLDPNRMSLLIVGHGTPRHPGSRRSTERLAAALRRRSAVQAVEPAFLDESPDVETQLSSLPTDLRIIVPFLIGGGTHALDDLPRRVGLEPSAAATIRVGGQDALAPGALVGVAGGARVIVAGAIGSDPLLTGVIARLATGRRLIATEAPPRGNAV